MYSVANLIGLKFILPQSCDFDTNTMGYGAGVGAWVGEKRPSHHPGGLGFGRGPIGVGFSSGVGRGYPHDMVKPHWPRALATLHHTPLKLAFGLGCPILHVSHHAPNSHSTHGLTWIKWLILCTFLYSIFNVQDHISFFCRFI
ncbi:hypothetical protein Hanom_Chr16g01461721 [Helianthus anomalus]